MKQQYFCLPLSFPSLPARLPESLHLLNSEVCAISVQHYERFPFCVSVCVRVRDTWGCLQ